MTTYYEDLLLGVGLTSLRDQPGLTIGGVNMDPGQAWVGLLDEGPLRGQNKVIPGVPGETGVELIRDAYDFPIPFNLVGATRQEFLSRLASLRALFVPTLMLLTRRLSTLTIAPFYEDDSCNGQYRGMQITAAPSPMEIDGVLTFRNLDGSWS